MAHQLSIFVENKPGKFEKITKILADNNLNVRGFSVASAGEFGILKIIVDKPNDAYNILKEHHITVSVKNILAVRIDDKSGSLNKLLNILLENQINIEDCYGISVAYNKSAAIIIEVEKFPDTEKILIKNNIKLLTDEEIYSL
ncbi:MAG TPA: ACT domain-containing protein [Spirochaetota bacterium]|nr:ACT domain-containing protein [Spirochaetota bacterium]